MFIKAAAANLQDDELVIGLVVNGDARAYPLGILYNREMVNDVVGGVPVLVTWCPLCYTAMVYDRRVGDTAAVFGNQGALYKGAMTWYDHDSGSVWSQPLGAAIAGPRSGSALDLIPAQLTTWGHWNTAHPGTKLLSVAQPVQPFTGQLPGDQHVVGLVIGDEAAAWPYNDVARVKVLSDVVGGIPVAIWSDVHTGAIRAADLRRADGTVAPPEEVLAAEALAPEASVAAGTGGGLRELPATIVYRSRLDRHSTRKAPYATPQPARTTGQLQFDSMHSSFPRRRKSSVRKNRIPSEIRCHRVHKMYTIAPESCKCNSYYDYPG